MRIEVRHLFGIAAGIVCTKYVLGFAQAVILGALADGSKLPTAVQCTVRSRGLARETRLLCLHARIETGRKVFGLI